MPTLSLLLIPALALMPSPADGPDSLRRVSRARFLALPPARPPAVSRRPLRRPGARSKGAPRRPRPRRAAVQALPPSPLPQHLPGHRPGARRGVPVDRRADRHRAGLGRRPAAPRRDPLRRRHAVATDSRRPRRPDRPPGRSAAINPGPAIAARSDHDGGRAEGPPRTKGARHDPAAQLRRRQRPRPHPAARRAPLRGHPRRPHPGGRTSPPRTAAPAAPPTRASSCAPASAPAWPWATSSGPPASTSRWTTSRSDLTCEYDARGQMGVCRRGPRRLAAHPGRGDRAQPRLPPPRSSGWSTTPTG